MNPLYRSFRVPGHICAVLRCFLIVALVAAAPHAFAQFRASLAGTVTDPSGAVIPGATVTLRDYGTNRTLSVITNSSGNYVFNQLPPDHFEVTVTQKGFEKKVLFNVQIIPEQANALNIQLQVGSAAQTVTVSGSQQPLLDTATATIGGTISSNEVQHLPSFNRDVFQLAQLAPGTFGDASQQAGGGSYSLPGSNQAGSGASDGIFKTENAPQFVANGGQNNANGISIDGISTESAVWGGSSVITPSEDSIEDVKVVSNGYDASNGRFSAAQVQVISKSGTNQIHGSAFFMADRPGLNAYQAWNGPHTFESGTPATRGLLRDESDFNQFGGSVGGPFWKNKLFGFFNYETLRDNHPTTLTSWYDTPQFDALGPSGSIAATYLTYPGAGVSAIGQIPVTCSDAGLTEGVNCRTVSGGLNIGTPLTTPLHTQDLTYVSSGTPGVGSGLGTTPDIAEYTTSNPNAITEAQYNGRLDANPDSKDRATFTIYWVPQSTTNYNGTARAYNLWHHDATNDAFTGLWDHTFSPTLLNEARANAAGWRWNEVNSNPQEPFGLPIDAVSQIGALNGSSSSLTFNYFGATNPSVFDQWTYSYDDVLTKVAGNHNIRMGGGLTRLYYLDDNVAAARPNYTFYNVWDFLNDAPEAEAGTFEPSTGVPTANREDNREDLWNAFVQDDWKATPTLTLNLGLRYSYFGPLSSKEGNLSTVVLGTGAQEFTGLHMRLGGNLYNAQKGNFGPEVGFAWTPREMNNRVVVRGGFGMNYNQEEIAIAGSGINNVPTIIQPTFTSTSPTQINPDILYAVSANVHSLYGYPANPHAIATYNSANLPTTGSVSVTGYPANLPTQYLYHYSLDTQYALSSHSMATIGYQGSIGRHLIRQQNLNVVGDARGLPLNPAVQLLDYYSNDGVSNYNALLATFKHQFAHGFLLDAFYTWAKSLDNGSQPYYEDPYPYNPHLAYGRSDFNVENAFKVYGLWQPVIFRGGHNLLEKTLGGWSLSGILNLHTGFPWTPTYSNITNNNLYYQGSGYSTLRPGAYLGGAGHSTSNTAMEEGRPNVNYPSGALAYFTIPTYTPVTAPFPAEFPAPPPSGVARNFLNGPNYRDLDATIAKDFVLPRARILGDNARLELRVDAYNVFNTVNLNVSSISTAISNDGVTSNPDFGQASSALGSRTLDIQARFSF